MTCANVLADKYTVYKYYSAQHKRDAKEDDIVYYAGVPTVKKSFEGELLDQLGCRKVCCRRHMLTHVDVF